MDIDIYYEYKDLVALFEKDEGLAWQNADTCAIMKRNKDLALDKYSMKNMVPSDIVSPDKKKHAARSKDKDANKIKTLVANEPIFSNGVYHSKGFQEAVARYFDISDKETRNVVLTINEEDQTRVLASLTAKLYESIVERVDNVDYGDIPNSKGDITKLKNYEKLVNCVNLIKQILTEYKQKTEPVDQIEAAIENLRKRKDLFERGYRYKAEMPILLYNTIALGIVSGVSYLIASCIEFIKRPGKDDFSIVLDAVAYNKAKDNILFSNLEKFNISCARGQVDTAMDSIIRSNMRGFGALELGGILSGGAAVLFLVMFIVPILRELTFFFYYSRTRVADYFDVQADLLQMNAHNIEKVKTGTDKKEVVQRQMKLVALFRKIAGFIEVSNKDAEDKTTKEILDTDKKYKTSEVMDSTPNSANSVLF